MSRQHILAGSAHQIPLPDGSVHCVVTSPPYYSLRKYAGEQEVDWPHVSYKPMPGYHHYHWEPPMRCALGLEPTPEAFIGHLVLVFREVKRTLRDDGVCWIVIGDSYGGEGGDLMGIPHRLMFALQGDGWIVRNDVVWRKVAPMPESVNGTRWERCKSKVKAQDNYTGAGKWQDRRAFGVGAGSNSYSPQYLAQYTDCPGCEKCAEHGGYVLRRGSWRHTRAHEFVLMCVKSMGYWSDQEKVREGLAEWRDYPTWEQRKGDGEPLRRGDPSISGHVTMWAGLGANPAGRNPRSVVSPSPESYSGAHYAVFPSTLIAPLIRAACPTRCCPICGAGWAPVVERELQNTEGWGMATKDHTGTLQGSNAVIRNAQGRCGDPVSNLHGYRPTCGHPGSEDVSEPGTVLDPFCGSGTTLQVAAELGLNAIGLDLSPEYLDQHAKPRIGLTPSDALDNLPLFAALEDTP